MRRQNSASTVVNDFSGFAREKYSSGNRKRVRVSLLRSRWLTHSGNTRRVELSTESPTKTGPT